MVSMRRDVLKLKTGFRWPAILGVLVTIAFAAVAGGWTWFTEINGAVIAQDGVEVASRPKSVQHLDGGIIEEILVTNGDAVDAGDVLLRLDSTLLAANLAIYQTRLAESTARRDRLVAEQEGQSAITWTDVDLSADVGNIALIQSGEDEIFRSRGELQNGRRAQLAEKLLQFDNQTEGVRGLIASKKEQLVLIETEIDATQTLVDRRLARESQLLGLCAVRRICWVRLQNIRLSWLASKTQSAILSLRYYKLTASSAKELSPNFATRRRRFRS